MARMSKERRQEIEDLKRGWASDPCFDLENTEGFEDVREELIRFREDMEHEWKEREIKRLLSLAQLFGLDTAVENPFVAQGTYVQVHIGRFAAQVEKLLDRIDSLEDRLEQAECRIDELLNPMNGRSRRREMD